MFFKRQKQKIRLKLLSTGLYLKLLDKILFLLLVRHIIIVTFVTIYLEDAVYYTSNV